MLGSFTVVEGSAESASKCSRKIELSEARDLAFDLLSLLNVDFPAVVT